MAGVDELLALAEYDRQSQQAANPMFALAQGLGAGMQKGVIDDYEKKKQLEQTKTGFAKLMQVVKGDGQDYQNKYKIKPTINSKGEVGYSLNEKSDVDQFSQAVQSGENPFNLRLKFPQYADQIDKLEIAGVFKRGTTIPSAPQGAVIPPAPQSSAIPSAVQPRGTLRAKGYDALGRPTGYELNQPSVEEQKLAIQQQEDNQQKEKATKMVRDSAQDTLNTIGEIKKGIKYFGAAGAIPPLPNEYSKTNWRANFDKLVSQRVLDVMTKLKEASKTGATGFGQLSEKELSVLQNASTVLKRTMSEEDATKYLNEMESVAQKVLGGTGDSASTTTSDQAMQELKRRGLIK